MVPAPPDLEREYMAKKRRRRKRKPKAQFKDIERFYGGRRKAAAAFNISVRTWARWKQKGSVPNPRAEEFGDKAEDAEFFRKQDWYGFFRVVIEGQTNPPARGGIDGLIEDLDDLRRNGIPVVDIVIKFRITAKPQPEDVKLRDLRTGDWRRLIKAVKDLPSEVAFEVVTAADKWQDLRAEQFPINLEGDVQLEL